MKNMLIGGLLGAAVIAAAKWVRERLEYEYIEGYAAGVGSMVEAKIGRGDKLHNYLKTLNLPSTAHAHIMMLAIGPQDD